MWKYHNNTYSDISDSEYAHNGAEGIDGDTSDGRRTKFNLFFVVIPKMYKEFFYPKKFRWIVTRSTLQDGTNTTARLLATLNRQIRITIFKHEIIFIVKIKHVLKFHPPKI